MKQFLLPLFLLLSHVTMAQQLEWGLGYVNQTPKGTMADNINAANGFSTQIGYRIPILKNKLVVSTEFGTGRYGKKSSNAYQLYGELHQLCQLFSSQPAL